MSVVINGRYRVVRRLGEGAEGAVLEVVDEAFPDRPTALKLLTGAAPDGLLLFEFEQLARLEHPHLVRVHDLGRVTSVEGADDDGAPIPPGAAFFTQDLVAGGPCDRWIAGLPEADRPLAAARVCVAAARALALLHERGLVHRDVKPSNILVAGDGGAVKLIDFGLSRLAGVPDGLRAGTLGFMAPEALQGYPDQRSDLYSLGATLGCLLTGRTPSPGAGFPTVDPPAGPAVSHDGLWQVARRLASPRAEDRYRTAGEAILALGRAAGAGVLGAGREGERIDAASEPEDATGRVARLGGAELVGRERELARLAGWIERATAGAGGGGVMVVHGPPGSGKSRLVRAAAVRVQLGAAAAGGVPPTCFAGSLRELAAALRRDHGGGGPERDGPRLVAWLGGPLAGGAGDGRQAGLVADLVALLAAAPRPALLLLEGAGGEIEGEVLRRLARSADAGLAVIAETDDEAAARGAAESPGIETLRVGPLDRGQEAALVRAMLGHDPGAEFSSRLHALTGGLPALTGQVIAGLADRGPVSRPTVRDLEVMEAGGPSTAGFAGWLLPRLSPGARRVAVALALLRDPCEVGHVLEVAGADEAGAREELEGLREIERRGLLAWEEGGRARLPGFVALEIEAALGAREARAVHGRALAMLEREGRAEPARLARHAVGAGRKSLARTLLRSAADGMAVAGDLGGAIQSLERWLELPGAPRAERVRAGLDLARLARQAGRYELAAARLEAVEAGGPGDCAAEARFERAALLRLTGRPAEARALLEGLELAGDGRIALEARALRTRLALDAGDLEDATRAVGPVENLPEPDATHAGLTGAAGLLELMRGDLAAAERVLSGGLRAAEAGRDPLQRARFESLLGMVAHRRGDFAGAANRYRAALGLAETAGDGHGAATYAVNLAAALTELDDIAGALAAYRQGLDLLERVGRSAEFATAGANYAELLLRAGDTPAALAASGRALESALASRDGNALLAARCVRGETLLTAGDPDGAETVLAEAAAEAGNGPATGLAAVLARHRAAVALAQGAPAAARRILEDAGDVEGSLDHARLLCELALAEGRVPPSVLEGLLGRLPAPGEPRGSLHVRPLWIAARAAAKAGEGPLARQLAREALALIDRVRRLTPPLHRPEEDPMELELQGLSADGGGVAAGPGSSGVGDAWAWERLSRINTRLNSEQRIGALLDLIMDTAIEITAAERGFLLVMDRHGRLRIRCARNLDRDRLAADDQGYSRTVALAAFETGEPVITTDAQADSRFRDYRSVLALELRYVLAVPLAVRGKPCGAIYVDSRAGARFDERRLALVRALADQAALALDNARLTAELRRRQRRIEKLNRRLEQRLREREAELEHARRDLERQAGEPLERYGRAGIVGRSAAIERVFKLIDRIAGTDLPVVITGESGTGKELVARAIHAGGRRRSEPFVAESCAAIPATLLESVLFGHVRGAFTGAVRDNPGLFAEADGGTLFLDELGDLPLSLQAKLLRVLQEGEIRPVGGTRTVRIDVRILAAANTDLDELVRAGRLREDLYYRLDVINVRLPPLRERREDIPLLAAHFAARHGGDPPPRFTGAALEALSAHSWPGNVRQLENEILRALVSADGEIGVSQLSEELLGDRGAPVVAAGESLALEPRVERLKAGLIALALERSGGNRTKAAALLGISRFGLQKMIERFGG
jgi:transcriptional regulator with GAF, ATPase, and Fis domain